MQHRTAGVRGATLHYLEAGAGEPVLLLAGWPQTSHAWRDVVPLLAQRYHVLALDVRGQGASATADFGYDALSLASDLWAFTSALGLESVHLAGHGLGAWTALVYATVYPERVSTLALLDAPLPGFVPAAELRRIPAAIAWPVAAAAEPELGTQLGAGREEALLRGLFADAPRPAAVAVDEYARWHANPSSFAVGVAYHRAVAERPLDDIEPLDVPVLALGGAASMGADLARAMRSRARDVTAVTIADAGHFLPEEQPAVVAQQLQTFFDGRHGLRFGAHTFIFTRRFGIADLDLLPQLRSHGFDGVEIARYDFDDFPVARIARAVRESGLACTLVVGQNPGASTFDADPAVREKAVHFLQTAVQIGAELGVQMISGPVYSAGYAFSGKRRTADEWARAIESFRIVGTSLTEHKLRLAIEPLNRYQTYFLNTQADTKRFCEDVGHPGIGVLFDMFHANIEEKDLGASLRMLGPRLFHVHASENDRGIPGSGHNAWRTVARTLRELHFNGWVVIESFTWDDPVMANAARVWRDLAPRPCDIAFDGLPFLKSTFGGGS